MAKVKTEFMSTIIVETKKKLQPKDLEKIRKWLQKGLTIDNPTFDQWPLKDEVLIGYTVTAVVSPGTLADWDTITGGK